MLLVSLTLDPFLYVWNLLETKLGRVTRQPACCCGQVTLVSSGVLGKDCRVVGLCAWNHTLDILPTRSLHTQPCKLDTDYGGANNTVFMVPAERQMTRDIESAVTEVELRKCFSIFSDKTGCCWWRGTPVNSSEIQLAGPRRCGRVHKAYVFRCFENRLWYLTEPSFVGRPGCFFLSYCVWLLAAEWREEGHAGCCSCRVGLSDSCPKVRLLVLLLYVLSVNK